MPRLLAALGLALLALAGGCGSDDEKSEDAPKTVRVGLSFSPGIDNAADRVAFEQLRRDTGIRAKFTETGGPPNTAAALLRGNVDMGFTSLRSVMGAIDEGADLKVVLGTANAQDFFLVARKDITSVAQLKGKRIAYGEPGGATEVVTKVALARAGVKESDVKLSVVDDAAARAAALTSGRVEAIALEYPDAQLLISKDRDLHTVASLYEVAPYLVAEVLAVRADYAKRNAKLVGEVVDGLVVGYERVDSPAGRREWLAEAGRVAGPGEKDVVADVYERHKQIGYWPRSDRPVTEAQHDRYTAFFVREGLLERPVPFGKVWAISFWRDAGES